MQRFIPGSLTLVSLAVTLALLIGCSMPPVVEDADVQEEVIEEVVVQEEEPAVEPVVTWREVAAEIRGDLSEHWVLSDSMLYDPANVVFRLATERGEDPIIMAYEMTDLANTILEMQPAFIDGREGGYQRALLIALDIYRGTLEFQDTSCSELVDQFTAPDLEKQIPKINPYIMAAMGYRESRFMKRTEVGYVWRKGQKVQDCRWCRGSRGERGMFQFMPGGLIQRLMPSDCRNPFDRLCSVRGAAKALATIRCVCIATFGSRCNVDTFVAGYGLSRMPRPSEARMVKSVVRARGYLCNVRNDCDDLWSQDHDDQFSLSL